MEPKEYGPKEPSMWLTRPVGYWANQLLKDFPQGTGPKRCGINYVTQIVTNECKEINVEDFRTAVMATIYNEPHLRTDVDLSTEPATWIPATDFSDVFHFVDLQSDGAMGLEGVWPLVTKEGNRDWQYGSGKPLFRCTLVRAVDCYVVMNYYHHGAGDGTTGMVIMGGIMRQYNLLLEGMSIALKPEEPRASVEVLTSMAPNKIVETEMLNSKIERLKSYKPYLPFEVVAVDSEERAINKTMFLDGSPEKYLATRKKCKENQVTVGSLSLAAGYLALAAVHAKATTTNVQEYSGMKNQYIDIPVNVRSRVQPSMGDTYCGFYVTELTTKFSIDLSTTVLGLSKEIKEDLDQQIKENRHIIFSKVKQEFECGRHKDLLAKLKHEDIVDLLVSNMKNYPFETDFSWGKIKSVHTTGSWWTPGFSNYLFLVETTDRFHYDMVYLPVGKNETIAKQLLSVMVDIMENALSKPNDQSLLDIIKEMD